MMYPVPNPPPVAVTCVLYPWPTESPRCAGPDACYGFAARTRVAAGAHRSLAATAGAAPATTKANPATAGGIIRNGPQLVTSFDGLNLRQERTANNGNQFTLEPPDQALCVGGGHIVEA